MGKRSRIYAMQWGMIAPMTRMARNGLQQDCRSLYGRVGLLIRIFNQNVRLPLLLLATAEAGVLAASVALARSEQLQRLGVSHNGGPLFWQTASVVAVLLVSLLAVGLYQFNQRFYRKEVVARLIVALAGGWLVLAALYFAIPEISLSRTAGAASGLLAFVGLLAVRYVFLRTFDQNVFRRRCLVFGAGNNATHVAMLRRASDRRGFRILGYVQPVDTLPTVADKETEAKVIPYDRPLQEIATECRAEEIIVALDDRRGQLPVKELVDARLNGVRVTDLLGFFERETGRVRVDFLRPSWIIFSEGFAINGMRTITKRALDLLIAIPALVVAAPVMLLTAACIVLENTGRSVFYRQPRVGEHGRLFDVLKFRSMYEDAEADGKPKWAVKNDARITRVGQFIRKTRVDELPQLITVLRGDMSIVGPRPERPPFVEELAAQIPFYAERHCVKPGITGWAQLRYPYGASLQDAIGKLEFDLYYVKNQNLLFDLAIMLQTVEVVLFGKGAR